MRTFATQLVLILGLALDIRAGGQSIPSIDTPVPARVVFVCEHGSVKSLVASVYFNRRAEELGLPYRAVARGITPDPSVPPAVREGLKADGFRTSDFVPKLFEASDAREAVLVVSFDQDLTKRVDGRTRYLKWDDLPGVLADYPRGRDAIVRQVDSLLAELTHGGVP